MTLLTVVHVSLSDPPANFSNNNLGLPEIRYVELSGDDAGEDVEKVPVTLLCEVAILNGIEKWKNVSYLIEWVAEGRTLKNETICEVHPGGTNAKSCPNRTLTSLLPGENYTIGQSVRMENLQKHHIVNKNKSGVLGIQYNIVTFRYKFSAWLDESFEWNGKREFKHCGISSLACTQPHRFCGLCSKIRCLAGLS